MATVNLGRIKPVFRGAYSGSTAYVVDDIVTHGNESFICIQAHGAGTQATSQGSYWTKLAAKGTDGTDVGTTITTQGDILYRDGSGLQRLAKGTAGQALKMNTAANAPEWGTISSGTYSVHDFQTYVYNTQVSSNSNDNEYVDIAGGNYLAFTPTSTNDYFVFRGMCLMYTSPSSSGGSVHVRYGTSTSLGSSSTEVFNRGTHANYTSGSNDHYRDLMLVTYLKATNLTPNTTYYAEMAGANHNQVCNFNHQVGSKSDAAHFLSMMHLKKN